MNITLQPTVLKWARERAGLDAAALAKKLNTTAEKVAEWETEGSLTYKRAEKLAEKTHTPFGYREAYSLLGVKKTETFNNFARQLQVN